MLRAVEWRDMIKYIKMSTCPVFGLQKQLGLVSS